VFDSFIIILNFMIILLVVGEFFLADIRTVMTELEVVPSFANAP